jgi:FixJ family two-component response regulator
MTKTEPTVFLVDDDHAVRDALELLLDTAGFNTVSFASATEFLESYDASQPGCLVLDIRMPGMSGMELQDALLTETAGLPIIFLTGHGNVSMSAKAFRTGAVDFLEKPFDEAVLLERIREALKLDRDNRESMARHARASSRLAVLTPREREVMLLLVAGNTNKEIAARLDLSTRTIETHRGRVMEKTGVQSVAELVELAISSGSYAPK